MDEMFTFLSAAIPLLIVAAIIWVICKAIGNAFRGRRQRAREIRDAMRKPLAQPTKPSPAKPIETGTDLVPRSSAMNLYPGYLDRSLPYWQRSQPPATNKWDAIMNADWDLTRAVLRVDAISSLERIAIATGKGATFTIRSPFGAFGSQKNELTVSLDMHDDPPVLGNVSPR